MHFLTVDAANTFFRSRHIAGKQSDSWSKVGFSIHSTLASINKAWRVQKADHVVICLEGRSWRKDFYKPYKANRAEARAALTEAQIEEDQLFWDAYSALVDFFKNKTNCTVLQHPELEADDLIAGWIQTHPEDKHTIVSSDTDYVQLVAENVNQYNGVSDTLITTTGILDNKGKLVVDKKTKLPLDPPNPSWLLFEKCMRGDPTDNVFSAYPGVRTKGSKNKIGLQEAFEDRERRGYAWNNLMLQKWVDHEDVEHRVLDDYERNRTLIDLSAQPPHIRNKINDTIKGATSKLNRPMIGAQFMKFCGKYELIKISEQAQQYVEIFTAPYEGTYVQY